MRTYSLLAPAKINLYLEILGDRPDGFHEMAMVMQSVGLADRVQVRANGTDRFQVACNHPDVPIDASNLAYRAATLLAQECPEAFARFGGVDITIDKHIPVGAGLAGGSVNAAAVLVGLDLMWNLGLTQSELQELGARLGSDIPFCISGGTAIATGRGEQLAPLPRIEHLHVLLAKYRSLSVSTAWAYTTYRKQFGEGYIRERDRLDQRRQAVHSGPMVSAIAQHNHQKIAALLHNDLEKIVLPHQPKVAELKAALLAMEPLGVMMSGSGPTVFALAETAEQAQTLQQRLRRQFPDPDLELWVTECMSHGVQVMAQ
ncbi:4-(cytidine 5'-diphospho)-2-C-methyl-D-erythritol kinase [Leptolyngbya sp. AN02str]|uniref:4-(cytidine 5'-diphospho)-2-C-methyl-D-erythritol kinase n=1 Tax=Leptolyngbya sp. AN02str TaxID=3423363 RepID=UPI003D312719